VLTGTGAPEDGARRSLSNEKRIISVCMKKDDAIGARKRGEGLHENFIAWYYAMHQLTEGRP